MIPESSPLDRAALPLMECPEFVWTRATAQRPQPRRTWMWVAAAAALGTVALLTFRHNEGWIQDGRIQIGEIGTVDVQPGSRVRVLKASPSEHRLELAEGAIDAEIDAPPRMFFVETPAVTAVDLGCKYHLETDAEGNGLLRVRGGWVSMGDSLVPVGASCPIRAGRGAGTPFFDDAPQGFVEALQTFDQDRSAIAPVLAAARVRDTLSLWHLLKRVNGSERELVLDRIAALTPLPRGVPRASILALDASALITLREELAWTW